MKHRGKHKQDNETKAKHDKSKTSMSGAKRNLIISADEPEDVLSWCAMTTGKWRQAPDTVHTTISMYVPLTKATSFNSIAVQWYKLNSWCPTYHILNSWYDIRNNILGNRHTQPHSHAWGMENMTTIFDRLENKIQRLYSKIQRKDTQANRSYRFELCSAFNRCTNLRFPHDMIRFRFLRQFDVWQYHWSCYNMI